MVATVRWLNVLSIITNVEPFVDLVVDAVVSRNVRLLLGLIASQGSSLMSTIWVLMTQVS